MLTELRIENFAIIDRLELGFESGLIIFTGETGAGKSIIMDAVEMLLGGRAETTVIRTDADRATVEGVFKITGAAGEPIRDVLKREELFDDPDYVTLAREVRREGRSIARVNGRTVNVGLLKEIGACLVDVHGQTEHLSLLDVRTHLGLLDRFADLGDVLASYRKTYTSLQTIRRELNELRNAQKDSDRRMEMLTFQAEEIEAARLKPGEDEELKLERDRLANAEKLATLAQEALAVLDEGTPDAPAATDLFGQADKALQTLGVIDKSQSELANRAAIALDSLTDLARDLRDYLDSIEFNPKRLEQVEERLDLIHRLQKKYGGTIESAMAFGIQARKDLETISNAAEKIGELEGKEASLLQTLSKQAQSLSTKRKSAADKLAKGIEGELDDLKMASARFGADFQTRPDSNGIPLADGSLVGFDGTGFDRVEFLVAPNPGEGIEAASQDRLGRRDIPSHAGAEKHVGARGPDPHLDLR